MNTLTLKNLVVYIEKEKFTPQNYERQMAYLQENTPFFQKVVFLEPENVAGFFDLSDMEATICLTTSPDMAKQMQGLGIAVLGFQAEEDEMMQANYVVLSLEQVTYRDFVRVFERYHGIPWQILETKRCRLREFCMDDLDDLLPYMPSRM